MQLGLIKNHHYDVLQIFTLSWAIAHNYDASSCQCIACMLIKMESYRFVCTDVATDNEL